MKRCNCPAERAGGHGGSRGGTAPDSRDPPDYGLKVAGALEAPGKPLPAELASRFGTSFGTDLSDVRVHDDGAADGAARGIGAKAFTTGNHIAFAGGAFAPGSRDGQQLIAHELAHVVQQRSRPAVQAKGAVSDPADPAEREADRAAGLAMEGRTVPPLAEAAAPISRFPYQAEPTTIDRSGYANLAAISFWREHTLDVFALTTSPRMASDRDEESAVLAAFWATSPPTAVTSPSVRAVPIAARTAPGGASHPALLYRFHLDPPAAAGQKPQLNCEFVTSGPGAIPAVAATPPAGFTPGPLSANSGNFPGNDRRAYFAAYPQELAQLMSFLGSAPPSVNQALTIQTRNAGGQVTHSTLLYISRSPPPAGGGLVSLDVDFIAAPAPAGPVTLQAGDLARDGGDLEIERLQRSTIAAANRLGRVSLPAGLTPDEHLAVNHAIVSYFNSGSRATEVDAVIPVGTAGSGRGLFTIRFAARTNDVSVDRIGSAGTGAGAVDVARIDVTRVTGFPGIGAPDSQLRSWWSRRYPAAAALTTPVPAPPAAGAPAAAPSNSTLIAEMSGLIASGMQSPSWFITNYGIEPLDPAAATARLENIHHAPVGSSFSTGTIRFSAGDLRNLEIALETAGGTVLAAINGLKLIRKSAPVERIGRANWQNAASSTYGFTVRDGSERSTLLFDNYDDSDSELFRGGTAADARPDSAHSILHELGHAAGSHGNVLTVFTQWLAAHPQAPQTHYAATRGGAEIFPEAFALFQTDPHFLCGSAPLLYAWFLEWTTSGAPPGPRARLTPPASCP